MSITGKSISIELPTPREGTETSGPQPVGERPPVYRGKRKLKQYPDLPALVAPDHSARGRVAEWIAIRAEEPHLKPREIAERMGIKPQTLTGIISDARKAGWLQFDDPLEKIEHLIVPKVVDNLLEFLEAKDKTVTLETAKGTIFKQYQNSKGISENPTNVLALKIEMPANPNDVPKLAVGQIVGQPKALT